MTGRFPVMNGDIKFWPTRAWFAVIALGAVFMIVNTTTEMMEHARHGANVHPIMPLIWESSSFIAWIVLAPFIGLAVRLFPPETDRWLTVFLIHLLVSSIVSLLHIFGMLGIRLGVFWPMGMTYDFFENTPLTILLYEWRKDVVSYLLIGAIYWQLDAQPFNSPTDSRADVPEKKRKLLLKDSKQLSFVLMDEIQWLQAAGNYVEIHLLGSDGPILIRQTLKSLEDQLIGHGFLRVHRSRIINQELIREITTRPSGDFDVVLEGGQKLGGARRHRAAVMSSVSSS